MEGSRERLLAQLYARKGEIKQALDRLMGNQREENDKLSQNGLTDESDLAQRETMNCGVYSLIERKAKELKKIEQLIGRLSRDESFGLCEECGTLIPPERLLIVPEATLCVSCQRDLERFTQMRRFAPGASSFSHRNKNASWELPEAKLDEDDIEFLDLDFLPTMDAEEPEGHKGREGRPGG